jgi:hypothetical protein
MFELPFLVSWVWLSNSLESGWWISQLGHSQYPIRVAAHRRLAQRLADSDGVLTVHLLEEAMQSSHPEVIRRARDLLAQFYSLEPSNYAVMPWIDQLPEHWPDRKAIVETYLYRARQLLDNGYYQSDWPDYRLATSLYVFDLLRQGMPRQAVLQMLDTMVEREKEYRRSRGMKELVRE